MSTNTRRNFIRLFSGAATSLPFLYAADPAFGQSAEKIKNINDFCLYLISFASSYKPINKNIVNVD